jgi:AcrR family transcriptional regulator
VADLTTPTSAARRDAPDRAPGRRGRATRRRLLDATAGLLEATAYRDLKVVDIARVAGTSPATFYQYFADVEEAVLALAVEVEHEAGAELASLVVDRTWSGADGWPAALALADGFVATWDRYRPVLRVIDLATDEGDQRFRAVRTRLLGAPAEALVGLLTSRRGGAPPDTLAEAGVLVSMLAHVAAHHEGLEHWGATPDGLRASMARVAYTTITGQRPPRDG